MALPANSAAQPLPPAVPMRPMKARAAAFDVTPAAYIDGIVTERGIARAPYEESLPRLTGDA